MKKNTVEIALIMLLVLMMYFQNDFINNISKSVLGKAFSLFAVWYVVENFGRNAGILAALIMISNLYNAYNPIVDTVEGFFESVGKPKGKPEGKPEEKARGESQRETLRESLRESLWESLRASQANHHQMDHHHVLGYLLLLRKRLMGFIKKRKRRGEGDGDDDDDNIGGPAAAPTAQGQPQGGPRPIYKYAIIIF